MTRNLPTVLDQFEDMFFKNFETFHKVAKPWLPYNYYKDADGNLVLEVALAGYTLENIKVEAANGGVKVKATGPKDSEVSYVHKGIAYRDFEALFPLQAAYEVSDAVLENGVLKVTISRNEKALNLIPIRSAA